VQYGVSTRYRTSLLLINILSKWLPVLGSCIALAAFLLALYFNAPIDPQTMTRLMP